MIQELLIPAFLDSLKRISFVVLYFRVFVMEFDLLSRLHRPGARLFHLLGKPFDGFAGVQDHLGLAGVEKAVQLGPK